VTNGGSRLYRACPAARRSSVLFVRREQETLTRLIQATGMKVE
jgi:hypothetical protein